MSISPFNVGDGRLWPDQAFTTDSGIFSLVGLLNSAIALHMEDINSDNALYICTGAWAITDGGNGKADFAPSVTDLTTGYLGHVGLYKVYPVVTLATGPVPMDFQIVAVVNQP